MVFDNALEQFEPEAADLGKNLAPYGEFRLPECSQTPKCGRSTNSVNSKACRQGNGVIENVAKDRTLPCASGLMVMGFTA